MRKILLAGTIAFVAASLAGVASAQVPTSGNVFFGYSFYNTNVSAVDRANTNGWEASLEGKVLPWVGIVADFDGHYGSENFPIACPTPGCGEFNVNISEHNVLFGPRVSMSVGRVRPFAEAMFGAGHVNATGVGTDTSFASALGGGFDYKLMRILAWRFQGDYVHTSFFGTGQNNVRLSTGLALRF